MARVTKPGGHVMVLEFGQVNIPVFDSIYNFYSQNILPKIIKLKIKN
jgi:demethylmenaquinone methyltransferase/2-methoxy-6-polyprenyl-1,4-benzoquinol methylase